MPNNNPTIQEAADLIAGSAGLTGLDRVAASNAIILLAKIVARETRYAAVDVVNNERYVDGTVDSNTTMTQIQNLPFLTDTREKPESFCFDLRERVDFRLIDMHSTLPRYVTVMKTAGDSAAIVLEKAALLIYEKYGSYIEEYTEKNGESPVRFEQ